MSDEKTALQQLTKTSALRSLKDLVRVKTAETTFLLLDCSGSMHAQMRNGKRRIDGLREVVRDVQAKRPTQMIAFGPFTTGPTGDYAQVGFVTDVPEPHGGTPLHLALDLAAAKGAGRVVVISDGWPNQREASLEAARRFGGRVDVVFVGDPNDPGQLFLEEVAKLTGGTKFEGDLSEVKEIAGVVAGLLNGEVIEEVPEGVELGAGEGAEDESEDEDDEDEDEDEDDE